MGGFYVHSPVKAPLPKEQPRRSAGGALKPRDTTPLPPPEDNALRRTESVTVGAKGAGGERCSAYVSDTIGEDGSLTISVVLYGKDVPQGCRAELTALVMRRVDDALARAQRAGLPVRGLAK